MLKCHCLRRRVFHKNRRSERWKILNKAFKHEDIAFPPFSENDIPQFTEAQVWKKLACIKINTSTRDGDAPAKLYKTFAAYLADPLTNILNCSIKTGQ